MKNTVFSIHSAPRWRVLVVLCGLFLLTSAHAEPATIAEQAERAGKSESEPASAAKVTVRGTRIRLMRPDGFDHANAFNGFQNEQCGAVIEVVEIPKPYASVMAELTDAGLEAAGVSVIQRKEVTIGTRKGILLAAKQTANGLNLNKWLLLFGDEKQTFTVAAVFPEQRNEELSKPLRECVLSAEFSPAVVLEQVANMPFTLKLVPPWEYAKCLVKTVIISPNGDFPQPDATKGLYVVGTEANAVKTDERRDFAVKHLLRKKFAKGAELDSCHPIKIDGLEGFESIGHGRAQDTGAAIFLYETLLFEPDGQQYKCLSGVVGDDQHETRLEQLRTMTRSFKRKPGTDQSSALQ